MIEDCMVVKLEQEIIMLRKANEGMSAACAESDAYIEKLEQERDVLKQRIIELEANQKHFRPCWCGGIHSSEEHLMNIKLV